MLGFIALSEAALSDIEVAEQLVQVTQDVTGVSSTATAGSLIIGIGPNLEISSVDASGATGTLSVIQDAAITLTSTAASASVGSTSVIHDAAITQTGVVATSVAGTLGVTLSAATTLTGVTSSVAFGTAADAFDADANTTLASVTATGSVSDIAEIHLTAAPVLTEATATLAVEALDFDAAANLDLDAVLVSIVLDDVEAKGAADFEIADVDASTDTTAPTVTLSAEVEITGVSSTLAFGTAADAFDADANIIVSAVVANVVANTFADVEAKAEIELGSVFSNTTLSSVELSIDTNIKLRFLTAIIVSDNLVANGVRFEYDPNEYDRSRVIYLNGQYKNNVVTIEPEIQTIYTTNIRSFNTVVIEPENRTVVVDKIPVNSTTVYIAA